MQQPLDTIYREQQKRLGKYSHISAASTPSSLTQMNTSRRVVIRYNFGLLAPHATLPIQSKHCFNVLKSIKYNIILIYANIHY